VLSFRYYTAFRYYTDPPSTVGTKVPAVETGLKLTPADALS
jgi:hypothetical protein